jgi:hypothetical protein
VDVTEGHLFDHFEEDLVGCSLELSLEVEFVFATEAFGAEEGPPGDGKCANEPFYDFPAVDEDVPEPLDVFVGYVWGDFDRIDVNLDVLPEIYLK